MRNKYLEKIAALTGLSTENLARRGSQLASAIDHQLFSKAPSALKSKPDKITRVLKAQKRERRVGAEIAGRELQEFNKQFS